MKKTTTLLLSLLIAMCGFSQLPLGSATLGLTLNCSGGTVNRTGISFNPNQQLYYSINAGSSNYPMETFDVTGANLATISQGFDYRGSWWNPNTNSLEGNGYSTTGIWIQNLDASYYPQSSGINSIPGVSGPDSQSSAKYDWNDDEILYYDNGSIYRYTRATHTLISTVAITGLPVAISNLNSNSIAFTGVIGMEAGVYDYINKAFYFINKTTGVYQATCQLPVSAPGPDMFQIGFANGYLWLYDLVLSQWKGYKTVSNCVNTSSTVTISECTSYTSPSGNYIYTSSGYYSDTINNAAGCDSIMTLKLTIIPPTTAIDSQTACDSFTWIDGNTYTSSNDSASFTIPNSVGCDSIITLDLTIASIDVTTTQTGGVNLAANVVGAAYQWIDCDNGNSPITGETNQDFTAITNGNYAVIVTENGCSDTSACILVDNVGIADNDKILGISLYPNPTNGIVTVLFENMEANQYAIAVIDVTGRKLAQQTITDNSTIVDLSTYESGVYMIQVSNGSSESIYRVVKR